MNKLKFVVKSFIDVIILLYYRIKFIFLLKKDNDTWLISERGNDARDNGYWFYKYMKENHPEISIKYVIDSKSPDVDKISMEDRIQYRSREHYYYLLYSKYLISAEIMGFSPNEQLYYRLNKYNFLKLKGKKIFLQHGITGGFNSYLLPQNTKLDLFICGAKPEYDFMISSFNYSESCAKLTGFARFDNLLSNSTNQILIMPTWRKWLKYNNEIKDTDYYQMFKKILTDKDIQKLLDETNYKIIFYPHIIMQKYMQEFKKLESKNVVIADNNNFDVQDLLKKSKLLITDYSSVHFDFAYMKKNVIYYQFDEKKYYELHCKKGYFDYYSDGFGPVCSNFEEVKNEIKKFLKKQEVNKKILSKVDEFFVYNDTKNCERIYNEITKL